MKWFGLQLLLTFSAHDIIHADSGQLRNRSRKAEGNSVFDSASSSPSDPILVRQGADGVPVMNIDDRPGLGLDTDGADTTEPWRDMHRGFFSTYTGARNALETPIAMRTQFIYWKIALAVLSATKIHDDPNFEMLEPFPKEDANGNQVYTPPTYKLSHAQLEDLYASDNAKDLRGFRAEAAACALYGWWKVGLSQYMQDEPRLQDMEAYLLQLKLEPSDRTHFGFDAWKDDWDFTVDVTGPCVTEKIQGKTYVSAQCVGIGITNTILQFQGSDGWNQLGDDDNTGQLIGLPFKETIGYNAVHIAGTSGPRRNWAPLVECKSGFCAKQEHVVPHIGFKGRTYFLSEADRKSIVGQVVKPLIVDYKSELKNVLDAMESNVAESPLYKSKISYHDNKFQFAAGTRQIRSRNKNTWEEQIFMQNGFLGVEYEGIVINWMAKVLNDHVRPPTVAQELLGDEEISSWQLGKDETKTYPAREWTAYIRTMPHGEFPSGSSCLCSGGVAIYAELFNRTVDDTSLYVDINFTNTNTVEPERFKDVLFALERYSSLEEYANECAQTRFYGGMHYEFSLEPGSKMCTTMGDFTKKAAAYNKYIWTGDETFLAPFGGIGNFGYRGDRDYEWY